jgi:regulatory protein
MKSPLTPSQAVIKAANFCAYQERCHKEVEDKLHEWGIFKKEAATIIGRLIEDGYLNEERFAKAYVGGKFRVKKWGRIKILQGLKSKYISPYCINIGMKEIDDFEYNKVLEELAIKKSKTIISGLPMAKRRKLFQYLIAKGFETEMCSDLAKKIFP